MSEGKTHDNDTSDKKGKSLLSPAKDASLLRDMALLFGWIAGLVFIAALFWFLTQPVRDRALQRAVNRTLGQSGDVRRLGDPISPKELEAAGVSGIGSWYAMTTIFEGVSPSASFQSAASASREAAGSVPRGDSEEYPREEHFAEGTKVLIFTFIGEGTFFPCAAVVAPAGTVEEFIPLSAHGERMMRRVSPGILRIYARRIEGGNHESPF